MKNVPFTRIQKMSWQKDYCMNFAIALARITGWLLHIDYWANDEIKENRHESEMILLRVYVGDNRDNIFDLSGIKKIDQFNQEIILPILKKHNMGNGGVVTRFYDERRILSLSIGVKPEESKILRAMEAIKGNSYFLEQIPKRRKPFIPAHVAAEYTFGRCSVYAQALQDVMDYNATAMIAKSYNPQYGEGKLGYIHSLVLHSDGIAEDVWGKQPIDEIARRFGVVEYDLSEDEHRRVVGNIKRNSPDEYDKSYQEAVELIREYVINT